jgi:hypothetical protein
MNIGSKGRVMRIFRLPISLLVPALVSGFAAVGQAQGIPQIVITAERPASCEERPDLRNQIQSTAREAVWHTQARVGADLSLKLRGQRGWIRLAGKDQRKRG